MEQDGINPNERLYKDEDVPSGVAEGLCQASNATSPVPSCAASSTDSLALHEFLELNTNLQSFFFLSKLGKEWEMLLDICN